MNRTVSRIELGDLRATHESFFPVATTSLEQALAHRPMTSRRLIGLVDRARDVLGSASWFAPQSQLLHDCAQLYGQAAYGCALVTASPPGESVEVTLRDKIVSVVCDEHARLGSVGEWASAWCAALAARDGLTIAGMQAIPSEQLRNPQVQIDAYQYALADALIAVNEDGDRCLATVLKCRELWKQRTVVRKSMAESDVALLSVLDAIVAGDTSKFNEALYRALTAHAQHWSKGDNYLASRGWIAIRHVGLACLAYDRGISIEVESPYLPRALIERTFSPEPRL